MLSFPSSQKAHSPVVRSRGGVSSPTSGRVVYRLVALTRRVRDDGMMLGEACKSQNPILIRKTKTCGGEENRDLEVDDSARGPFKAGRECGGGGGGGGNGGFCLETTLSNLLQDADISRNTAVGVSWGGGCHSPRCEIKTARAEPAGCGRESRKQPACSLLARVHVFSPDPPNTSAAEKFARALFLLPGAAGSGPLNGGGPDVVLTTE